VAIREPLASSSSGSDGETEEALSLEQTSGWLSVPGGYELTVAEADDLMSQHESRVIVFAGEPDAGKTTLMATIFEEFSKAMYGGYRFAGSETILAFERACFPSRISSGAVKPDTDRTKYMRPRFYHLKLNHESSDIDDGLHLLLADVSGEAFRRATDTEEDARKLEFIKCADAFVLIIDGERLTSRKERQDTVQRGTLLLRALIASRVLTTDSKVKVLLTKFDLLAAADENTKEFVRYTKQEFNARFRDSFRVFEVREIAARPLNSDLPFGYEVEGLVSSWLQEKEPQTFLGLEYTMEMPDGVREADAFLWRQKKRSDE